MQLIPEQFGLLSIVLILFLLTVLVQLFYYWFFFARLAFYKKREGRSSMEAVSVVIAAKNEYHNLRKNLPLILEQDYPEFEVIVVNDASDDDTAELLEELEITAEIGEPFAESLHDNGTRVIRLICCHARFLGGDIYLHAHDEFRWCTSEELLKLHLAPADLPLRNELLRKN